MSAVIFEPDADGHQAEWLAHLVRGAASLVDPGCRLWLVVARTHKRTLEELIPDDCRARLRIVALSPICGWLCTHRVLTVAAFTRFWTMRHYLHATGAQAGHFLAIDLPALPLALGFGRSGPRLSGILFRAAGHEAARPGQPHRIADRLRDLRKRLVYRGLWRNPAVSTVLSLDPFFVDHAVRRFDAGGRIEATPDPTHPEISVSEADRALAATLPPGRIAFTLFGYITQRKGAVALLEALRLLPPEIAGRVAVLVAGRVEESIRDRLAALQRRLAAERPELWCTIADRWLSAGEIEAVVQRSDVVLAPYQRFVGSSGVLLWAARAAKPVLAQDSGLIGRLVAHHRLGLAVDTTRPDRLAAGMALMVESGAEYFIDRSAARALAAAQTPTAFARSIFAAIFGPQAVRMPGAPAHPAAATRLREWVAP